jgi:predicted nucleic acid-binding protein
VILVDTGPLVALFDPKDAQHQRCREMFAALAEPMFTTTPVLTEVFHMLAPGSQGAARLRDFLLRGGMSVWFMEAPGLARAFALMNRYADHPMDLADASLVTAAEALGIRKVFTLDRNEFATYRVQRGHRHDPFEVVA